jgi:cytochrome c-type biogenesis protein CcsB
MKIFLINDYQLPIFSCFFFFVAMIIYWISLSFPKNNFLFQIGQLFVLISNIFLILTLSLRWLGEGYFPLSNLYESLIFLSCGICSIHLYIEYKTKSRLIGSLIVPLLFFLTGFSSLTLPTEMQKALPLVPSLQSNWLMMHVSMMMISYSILIIGSLFSILYLFFEKIQNSNLSFFSKNLENFSSNEKEQTKKRRFVENLNTNMTLEKIEWNQEKDNLFENNNILNNKKDFSLKNSSKNLLLQTIDLWSYRIIGLGFPFLTIGIISGAVWANEAWGSYWSWDPKETWAFITWLVFAIYLHSRLLKGWQGQKAAFLGSCGFFVIWICYLGVNFLGKGLHSYGWIL